MADWKEGQSKYDYEISKSFCSSTRLSNAHILSFLSHFAFDKNDNEAFVCSPFSQLPVNNRDIDLSFITGTDKGLLDLFARDQKIGGVFDGFDQVGFLFFVDCYAPDSDSTDVNDGACFVPNLAKPQRSQKEETDTPPVVNFLDKPSAREVKLQKIHDFYKIITVRIIEDSWLDLEKLRFVSRSDLELFG